MFQKNDGGTGTYIELESYLGYGSVIHLDTGRLHHSDFTSIKGGQVDSTHIVGKDGAPQPVAYTMATLARFMETDFTNTKCGDRLSERLGAIRNNTVTALSEYAGLHGISQSPSGELKSPCLKIVYEHL